jgi:uncharacterized protein YdhG (YjbR/CyaY superfamily)
MKKPGSVDEYIAAQPPGVAKRLRQIRELILKEAPEAQEKLSYGMPFYSLNGRLIYFMAHDRHIGIYPMKSAIKKFEKELAGHKTHVATIQLPHDKPLPLTLIKKIVAFRAAEQRAKIK